MTAEDIKRICIDFKHYCESYNQMYDTAIAENPTIQIKTDEELYDDYTNKRPVTLERKDTH